jgi:hypothetical protein
MAVSGGCCSGYVYTLRGGALAVGEAAGHRFPCVL